MLGQSGVPESAYHQLHVEGTRHLLQAAAEASVERILYISSPGVLGPINGKAAEESAPLAPGNPYERSKAAAEKVVLAFAGDGLPVVIVRPEFVYGPGDLHVLGLFKAVQRGIFFYIGGGQAVCHPTYIDDLVRGMELCLEKGRAGEIYHIVGPQSVTFQEYGQTIAAVLGVRKPRLRIPERLALAGAWFLEGSAKITGITPPHSRTGVAFFSENRHFSWEKARQELGYEPQVDLAAGVQRTADWYRQKNLL
jgi:nucleoside-diphosphate-sugar epimerase